MAPEHEAGGPGSPRDRTRVPTTAFGAKRAGSGARAVLFAALGVFVGGPLVLLVLFLIFDESPFEPVPPSWAPLAEHYEPPAAWRTADGESAARPLELPIEPERWKPSDAVPGLFVAQVPELYSPFRRVADSRAELLVGGRWVAASEDRDLRALPAPPALLLGGTKLSLLLAPDASAPAETTLRVQVRAGERVDGRWRVASGEFSGDGWVLAPGEPVAIAVDAPGNVVRFWTSVQAAEGAAPREPQFRVFAGDDRVAEFVQRQPLELTRLELRSPGSTLRTLRFEVDGPPSAEYCVLGAAWGAPGFTSDVAEAERRYRAGEPPEPRPEQLARRQAERRPDLILFSCDTFRADNMTVYGGTADVTPNLDAFAREGTVFRRSWSSSSWTLPSHASMLHGLHPYQHGAVEGRTQPAAAELSLARRLAQAGYRTVAVTEGLFLSRDFQMDRGFEVFREVRDLDFEQTLETARALLAADDGRPTFLFIHSYRVHAPYRISEATRAEHGERLGIAGDYDGLVSSFLPQMGALLQQPGEQPLKPRDVFERSFERSDWYARFNAFAAEAGAPGVDAEAGRGVVENLRRQYLGGVVDFDREFGHLLETIRERDAGNTCVVFTSDHGELFGEHEKLLHGRGTWDALLRVPLVIWGPELGIPAAVVEDAATSVDLPPTLCQIADLAPDRAWSGRPLLVPAPDASAYVFDCAQFGEPSGAALVANLKLCFPIDPARIQSGEALAVYDLDADPGETTDLTAGEKRDVWAELRERADELATFLRPVATSRRASLEAVDRSRMEALGYTGEE